MNMTGETHGDVLTRALGEMTSPRGGTDLWRRAIEETRGEPAMAPASAVKKPIGSGAMLGLAASVVLVLVVWIMLPSLGKARKAARRMPDASAIAEFADADSVFGQGISSDRLSMGRDAKSNEWRSYAAASGSGNGVSVLFRSDQSPTLARQVVRRASMQLTTPDVRAAVVMAHNLVSAARGEFVQESNAREGAKGRVEAELTLRVEAGRLDEVIGSLRGLGEVRSERVVGEDVTGRVVDIEANLRNEQRVEEELLALLDSRENADLDDILKVRRELSQVRARIEGLAGERDQLGALVRLATVAVVLREPDAETEEVAQEETGLWAWFDERMGSAWNNGLRTLLATIAVIVEVAVSGAVWFIVGGVVGAFAWRRYRAERPRALPE